MNKFYNLIINYKFKIKIKKSYNNNYLKKNNNYNHSKMNKI